MTVPSLRRLGFGLLLGLSCAYAFVVPPSSAAEPARQSLTVYLVYDGPESGYKAQYKACDALTAQVGAALTNAGVGENAGIGTSAGEYLMYLSGPSADAMFKVVEPVLKKSPLSKGGKVALRYGGEGAREVVKKL